ncbi:hypothetical protein LZ554_003070 [Drepanopeziza brunnea f. sp. 'monogermtubi']|nr:hypothetical protein LZ554_003070 [Drepanopeziza brunnea f. sp. 'monogermtubi']
MMLSVVKSNRTAAPEGEDSSSSDEQRILPPGTPYLTKVNGKLVWARQKTHKVAKVEAFLPGTTVVRERSKSLERLAPRRTMTTGPVPVVRAQRLLAQSTPIAQQQFQSAVPPMAQYVPQYYTQYQPQMMQQLLPEPPRMYVPQQQPQQQPQQPQRPPRPPPPPLFVQPSPTPQDFEQLKAADAHFNGLDKPQPSRVTSFESESTQGKEQTKPQSTAQDKLGDEAQKSLKEKVTLKASIAVTRHICGNCGRIRSRKYHYENPLKPGEIPTSGFCLKCQRDASSTSGSDTAKESKKKDRKNTKKKGKSKKKPVVALSDGDDDDDDCSDHPAPEPPKKPTPNDPDKPGKGGKADKSDEPNQALGKRVPSPEYISIEVSEDGREVRGRSRSRSPEEYVYYRRPISPPGSQHSRRSRSHSIVRSQQDTLRKSARPVKIREVVKDTVRRQSPLVKYRYVEVIREPKTVEPKEKPYPRKIPIQFEDEAVHDEPAPPPKLSRESETLHQKTFSYQTCSVEEPEGSKPGPPSTLHGFEVREASNRGPPTRHHSFERETSVRGQGSIAPSSDSRHRSARDSVYNRGASAGARPSRGQSFVVHEPFVRDAPSSHRSFQMQETPVRDHPSRDPSLDSRRRSIRGSVHEEQGTSTRGPATREYSFEERETISPERLTEARRRRRRERGPPGGSRPFEEQHVIHPKDKHEFRVVTETSEYRNKEAEDAEGRRRQEYIDRATLDSRKSTQLPAQEAEKYYHGDWSRPGPDPLVVPSNVRKPYQEYRSYRRPESVSTESGKWDMTPMTPIINIPYQEYRSATQHVSDYSESSEDTYQPAHHGPPRVPSPPSAVNSYFKVQAWNDEPPYPMTPDEKVVRMPKVQIPIGRQRSNSKPRPAYLRSETEEMALVRSPRHSSSFEGPERSDGCIGYTDSNFNGMHDPGRNRDDGYQDSNFTEMRGPVRYNQMSDANLTELERLAEGGAGAGAQHVLFRDTPLARSMYEPWLPSEIKSQLSEKEYDASGWRGTGGDWIEIGPDDEIFGA